MKYIKKKAKQFISTIIVFAVFFSFLPMTAKEVNASEENYPKLTFEEEQGSILHAWDWSFKTIEENLQSIADSGYTAIQVSPIQGNKDIDGNDKDTKEWWILYQPINFKIGNKQLGTRDEFIEMCRKAKEKGIKIYVDVIANHTGNTDEDNNKPNENVDADIKQLGDSAWHMPLHSVASYDDRYEVTHGCVGLPDLNTENKEIQKMFRSFLEDCLKCGADGFRVDTAKHIGLPTDDEKSQSDFWTNTFEGLETEEGSKPYVYGEVLQGGADNFNEYSKYINLTSSNYGNNVRKAVGFNSDIDLGKIKDYDSKNVSSSELITWVESHDTYANDSEESTGLTDTQIKSAWALIASRAKANPLFFNRPAGRGKLDGSIGDMGDDLWRDADVIAVNKFRNAMKGKDENLAQISKKTMMIERGNKEGSGVVIVNMDNDLYLTDEAVNLEDGSYSNLGANNSEFVVKDGKINGTLKNGITVLYNGGQKEEESLVPKVSISPDNKSFSSEELILTLNSENTPNATYRINNGEKIKYSYGDSISIGKNSNIGDKISVVVEGDNDKNNRHSIETYNYIKKDSSSCATVYLKRKSKFKTAYIYAYNELGEKNAAWPGEKMTYIGNNTYKYELKDFTDCNVIFNDWFYGSNKTSDLNLGANEKMIYDEEGNSWNTVDKEITEDKNAVEDFIKDGTSKVYFKKPADWNDFSDVCIYFYGNGGPEWPGVPMKKVEGEEDLYTYTFPEGLENSMVLFNANSGKIQVPKDTGFKAPANSTMIYDNEWHEYLKGNSKVYFRKPSDWSEPNVYVWKDKDGEIEKWPGIAMTKVDGCDTLYSYTLHENYGDAKVIFNDGNKKTKDLELPSGSIKIYDNDDFRDFKSEDLEEPEVKSEDEGITKIYFKNTDNWDKVCVHYWNEGGEVGTSWPGKTAKDEGDGLFSYTLPKGFESANVIFNNGGNGKQTDTIHTKVGHSMIYDYEKKSLEDMTKVYFKNSYGWDKVCIHYWNDGGDSTVWPGERMTYHGDNLYSYEMKDDFANANVIFNNNNKGSQTKNLKSVKGQTMIFDSDENWREYDEKDIPNTNESEDDKDDENTELTKAYFYNSEDWKDLKIYVYTEDENGNMEKELKPWPGVDLQLEKDKLYSYTLPKKFKTSVLIFNGYVEETPIKSPITTSAAVDVKPDSKNKVSKQTGNLKIKSGEIMIYDSDKIWRKYTEYDKENSHKDDYTDAKESIIKSVEINGTIKVNKKLTADVKIKNGESADLSYRWQRSNSKDDKFTDINGATSKNYTLTSRDKGKYIRVIVTDTKNNIDVISNVVGKIKSKSSSSSSHHHSYHDTTNDDVAVIAVNNNENNIKDDSINNMNDVSNTDNGWVLNEYNDYQYFEDSKPVTGWKEINGVWYFMNEYGIMQKNWIKDNNTWYYLNADGTMVTGWVKDLDGRWYYLNEDGSMKVGWLNDYNDNWYYLEDSGAMETGWKEIDGIWYYFYESGEMARNVVIFGYIINDNGEYVA